MIDVPQSLFDVFALSLPRGLAFAKDIPVGAWSSDDGVACGALTVNDENQLFGILLMRRREDDVWVVKQRETGIKSESQALNAIRAFVTKDAPREPVPPGIQRRPALWGVEADATSNVFRILLKPSHHAAAWLFNQLYLALPKPDPNWASDCRTQNFHTRLWEAHLLACFREQGLLVEQDHTSPDFHISNRLGGEAWIEAVTANPQTAYDHANTLPSTPPEDLQERLIGPPAVRFAKTIRSKLQKKYHHQPHVFGKTFAIALADFQASGSMTWSREALMSYLYGIVTKTDDDGGRKTAYAERVDNLLGDQSIPSGLFNTSKCAELSAVVFSNACSIAKLNRVAISSGADRKGYRYIRYGTFFDRTPGVLESIPFCFDVSSNEYKNLWPPYPHEPWSAELEVFHNPFAQFPFPNELLPEATHWRKVDDEIVCRSFFEMSVLKSITLVMDESLPMPSLEKLMTSVEHDEKN
jgi:hypothetical protein